MAPTKLLNKTTPRGGSSSGGSGGGSTSLKILLCLGGIGFFVTNQILQSKSVVLPISGQENKVENGAIILQEILKNQKQLTEENLKLQKELAELKQKNQNGDRQLATSSTSQAAAAAPAGTAAIVANPLPATPTRKLESTKFTQHVQSVLDVIESTTLNQPESWSQGKQFNYHPQRFCPQSYSIFVDKPYSPPTAIECQVEGTWCALLVNIFSPRKKDGKLIPKTASNNLRILPYNVSLGISNADMIKVGTMAWGNCIGSSGPNGGQFSMNNFQHAKAMIYDLDNIEDNLQQVVVPWEERDKIPIFRGHSRLKDNWMRNPKSCPTQSQGAHITKGTFGQAHRAKAVLFSLQHPQLLNARITDHWHSCMWLNATNGMDQLFGLGPLNEKITGLPENNKIDPQDYYNKYQVAVVLGGIGAAFRTSSHLAAGQAIVLQRFTFEEWFVPYMKPYVHYIPLKEDLSDLQQVLEWVRDHPSEVKAIAQAGKQFHTEWLSYDVTWEHWHEMLYRLSESLNGPVPAPETKQRLQHGVARQVWPAPIIPLRYVRDKSTGMFVLEPYETTRIPYWEVDGPPESREMCKKNPVPAKNNPNTGWCK